MTKAHGIVYLVATPIGNLEDMSFRAIRILKEVDYIFCEDTRRTSFLLKHFKIDPQKPLKSFHDHSHPRVLEEFRQYLEQGCKIAYVSDAGMPAISDPGFLLVRTAVQRNAIVSVIPGPTVAPMIFSMSALASPKFFFHGFFPRTKKEISKVIELVQNIPVVHIFYESATRLVHCLEILNRSFPYSSIAIGRELTKIHEEVVRGSTHEVYETLKNRDKIKGECVVAVICEASTQTQQNDEKSIELLKPETQKETLSDEQKAEIQSCLQSGMSSKDASKLLSKKFNLSRRIIYEFIIHHLT